MDHSKNTRQLIVQEIPRLRRYARSLCFDAEDADDLVQSCLERALSRLTYFQAGTNLRAWLLTIMHNIHVNNVKRSGRDPATPGFDIDQLPTDDTGSWRQSLTMRDLERAIARLSVEHREALLLVGIEQYSYEEAARIAGISIGTMMSRLHRARRQLIRLMQGDSRPAIRRVELS